MQTIKFDLHIHTCLSPCATLDMTPMKIVQQAVKMGLDIIAVTDHNSAENAGAVMDASAGHNLFVIPGMEITTSEEVHILGLFSNIGSALSMQKIVFDNLQPGENDEELFGMQVISNRYDEVEGFNKRLLIGATSLGVKNVVDSIHSLEGIAIAAHIDRESFSIISQLGFIPPDLPLDALEISKNLPLSGARKKYTEYNNFPFITSSDSHSLEQVGTISTCAMIEIINIDELRKAFLNTDSRQILE